MASVVHYPGQRLLRAALWAFAIVIFSVQLAPLVVLIPLSFTSGTLLNFPIPSFSLRWYGEFFGSAQWLGSLRNTFVVGVVASTIATILGTLGAIGVLRVSPRLQPFLMALLISPMVIPLVVVGGECPRCPRCGVSGQVVLNTVVASAGQLGGLQAPDKIVVNH